MPQAQYVAGRRQSSSISSQTLVWIERRTSLCSAQRHACCCPPTPAPLRRRAAAQLLQARMLHRLLCLFDQSVAHCADELCTWEAGQARQGLWVGSGGTG